MSSFFSALITDPLICLSSSPMLDSTSITATLGSTSASIVRVLEAFLRTLSYDVHSLSCEWYGLKLYLRRLFPAKSANGISHVLLEVPVIE